MTGSTLEAGFAAAMDRLAAQGAWPGAVAVSGGGDSLALMHLLAAWATARRLPAPVVISVDHRLQRGSAKMAEDVLARARKAGLKAHLLSAKGPAPQSDIEAEARRRRFSLIGPWLTRHKLATLYLGHTEDDQAETFLLRLGRGSGLDGLSGMRMLAPFPLPGFAGLRLARPLLEASRADLRAWLGAKGLSWLEDPMNSEGRFARVKLRALAPVFAEAGLSVRRIADAARHLARAREALDLMTEAVLARAVKSVPDAVLVDPHALVAAPREIGLRALARLLMGTGEGAYRPRFEKLEALFDRLALGRLGGGATLGGCRIGPAPRRLQVFGPQTLVLTRESSRSRT